MIADYTTEQESGVPEVSDLEFYYGSHDIATVLKWEL
jgi:hypothetical protein